ncbi:MAG: Asp-tRNA(Asn)/Glu-tRNA(Gln) amidotransferase subunit GatC [Planctomycetes bacterium]|nr:Asp-tRNA(Asn)/Glu-tRNA(Gln) amidotransferase subunit GatC [Planctomycetota bacterium]
MPKRITIDEVRRLADLARLRLTADEEAAVAAKMSDIVAYFEQLEELDLAGVPSTAHAVAKVNVLRDDEERPSLPRKEALRPAAKKNDEFFLVPPVIGGDGEES